VTKTARTVIAISITELVDFSCRRGDLMPPSIPSVTTMQGMIAHQRLQTARKREAGYQAEFTVTMPMRWHNIDLLLRGRVDGVWLEQPRLEEIKTLAGDATRLPLQTRDLHWAQAKFYAFCLCTLRDFTAITVQVTYANIEGRIIESQAQSFALAELKDFVEPCIASFVEWQQYKLQHIAARNDYLHRVHWPFVAFRQPQRVIAETVYKAIHQHSELLSEAPTGTGKTMAHLFPALKALAAARPADKQPSQRIVWLTAKTSAQHSVLQALNTLNIFNGDTAAIDPEPAPLRVLQLSARDKLCFCRAADNDCASPCPYTLGYYDRLPQARRAACDIAWLDMPALLTLAQGFTVCPFQLALDLVAEADIVIGDVNYVFDPLVAMNSLTGETASSTILLIDEAHNLIDRSRDMYSATIAVSDVMRFIAELKTVSKSAAAKTQRLLTKLTALEHKEGGATFEDIGEILRALLDHYGIVAGQTDMPDTIGTHLRPLIRTTVISELAGEQHRLLMLRNNGDLNFHITNLDPSPRNAKTLELFQAAILFSGTLTPVEYSRNQLGLADAAPTLQIASPFATENLHISVCTHIDTRFQQRESSAQSLADLITTVTEQRPGNYLCAFPSYHYLEQVRQLLIQKPPKQIIAQSPTWTDADRDAVILQLKSGVEPTLVLGIIGGSLGESIDLPGDSLIGVIVVGLGLHAPDAVSELRRQYFDHNAADGYALAYQFPGWQRVVQTAGRLIRSEDDMGVLVLVDPRHARGDYKRLWPQHWRVNIVRSNVQCMDGIEAFWRRTEKGKRTSFYPQDDPEG